MKRPFIFCLAVLFLFSAVMASEAPLNYAAEPAGTEALLELSPAAAMGGSQIYLEQGGQFPMEELIKAVIISSANDAAVALAEEVAGSEASFVQMMNERPASAGRLPCCSRRGRKNLLKRS